jgi:hypothetical protein
MLHLSGGKLRVHWNAYEAPIGIDLPEEEEEDERTVIPPVYAQRGSSLLEEWNADALPEEKNATDTYASLSDPTMLLEKQRVKEARLKARLAVYRAQYEMNQFYDKYGNEISDSDSEQEEDEDEEDEEDEDEPALFL